MKNKKISIKNNQGQKLIGIIDETSKDKLVILCHGYKANKDMSNMVNLSKKLSEEKISNFRFDFSGCGESDGNKFVYAEQQAKDLKYVIKYFDNKYKNIYVLGHSLGVLPALIGSKNTEIKGIISINGFLLGNIIHKGFERTFKILKIIRFIIPKVNKDWRLVNNAIGKSYLSKPTLVIVTKNDEILDYRQSVNFVKKMGKLVTLKQLKLSGHSILEDSDQELIVKTMKGWMNTL